MPKKKTLHRCPYSKPYTYSIVGADDSIRDLEQNQELWKRIFRHLTFVCRPDHFCHEY